VRHKLYTTLSIIFYKIARNIFPSNRSKRGYMRLVTDRLLIRKFSESDCIDLAQILADPQVMEFSESGALTEEEVKFKLQRPL